MAVPSSCLRDYIQSISGPVGKQEDQTQKRSSNQWGSLTPDIDLSHKTTLRMFVYVFVSKSQTEKQRTEAKDRIYVFDTEKWQDHKVTIRSMEM